jgi:hypothetical protein
MSNGTGDIGPIITTGLGVIAGLAIADTAIKMTKNIGEMSKDKKTNIKKNNIYKNPFR